LKPQRSSLAQPKSADQSTPHTALGISNFLAIRQATSELLASLSDASVQSMPDASPAKWHLAHTTWSFEAMVLTPHVHHYRRFDDGFEYLFNSYYESVGERHPRSLRGMLTRPSLREIFEYRAHVDAAICKLLDDAPSAEVSRLIELGCNHEQQHQELALTDLLNLFSRSSIHPVYAFAPRVVNRHTPTGPTEFLSFDGGLFSFGNSGLAFSFDCECPGHLAYVDEFRLASRLVTNKEWLEFMYDGGYRPPLLWLSNGWSKVRSEGWTSPLYWEDNEPMAMTLKGPTAPRPGCPRRAHQLL
jgi:ergothioneine biosynthesis protein EgtB